jgi:hypothetical protein
MGFVSRDAVDAAAPEQIEKMSRHPAWWARLYAAEVLRRHRELGTDAMVQRLAGDGNRLVREAAAAIGDARR